MSTREVILFSFRLETLVSQAHRWSEFFSFDTASSLHLKDETENLRVEDMESLDGG